MNSHLVSVATPGHSCTHYWCLALVPSALQWEHKHLGLGMWPDLLVNKTDVICVGLWAKPVPPLSRSQISRQLSNFIYATSYPRHSQSIVARAHMHTAGLTDCCQSVSPLIETKCSNFKLNNFSDFTTDMYNDCTVTWMPLYFIKPNDFLFDGIFSHFLL